MGLRFTRRLSLIPGLRVNLSKGGASLTRMTDLDGEIVALRVSGLSSPKSASGSAFFVYPKRRCTSKM
jgi:hypothetical protein